MGHKITNKDIISLEVTVIFSYKKCEVTLKRFDDIYKINIKLIDKSGYILEKEEPFINTKYYEYLSGYLNDELANIEKVYEELKKTESNFNNNLAFMG